MADLAGDDMSRPGCCVECDENYRDSLPEGDVRRIIRPFIVCSTCGNKRCPKATLHTLACTGSNEPGQAGSVYTAGRHWTAHKDAVAKSTVNVASDVTPERDLLPKESHAQDQG